jgi:hypothetical protein
MRFLLPALLSILVVSHTSLAAGEPLKAGEGIDPPAQGFGKLSELFRWASKSSFGGGGISSYHVGDRDVHVVSRSFTSGKASTELSFYVLQSETKLLTRVLHLPLRQVELRSRQDTETGVIIIEQYDYRKGAWAMALTVTAQCFDP